MHSPFPVVCGTFTTLVQPLPYMRGPNSFWIALAFHYIYICASHVENESSVFLNIYISVGTLLYRIICGDVVIQNYLWGRCYTEISAGTLLYRIICGDVVIYTQIICSCNNKFQTKKETKNSSPNVPTENSPCNVMIIEDNIYLYIPRILILTPARRKISWVICWILL